LNHLRNIFTLGDILWNPPHRNIAIVAATSDTNT
jgi:hypothetical protein